MRRLSGQLQTEDLLRVAQVERRLIERTAAQATNDFQVKWGAAELVSSCPIKRVLFAKALEASG
jgi:hypothetical protein